MKFLRTYEGYYDPPEEGSILVETVMDIVWELFVDFKDLTNDEAEKYIDEIETKEDTWKTIEDLEQDFIIDEEGNYPWSEEIRNEVRNNKNIPINKRYWTIKDKIHKRLFRKIAEKYYKILKEKYPPEEWRMKKMTKKFNL